MTYYTTAAGAEVFDAGTIDFGGAADNPYVARMLANLWTHMSGITRPLPPKPTSGRAAGPANYRPKALSLIRDAHWWAKPIVRAPPPRPMG